MTDTSPPSRDNRSVPAWLAVLAIVTAGTLFGISNVAWRVGEGSAVQLAAWRATLGVVLVSPWLIAAVRSGAARAILTSRWGLIHVLTSGLSVLTAAMLFRQADALVAASVVASAPVILLLAAPLYGGRRAGARTAALAVAATALAVAANFAGGTKVIAAVLVAAAVWLLNDLVNAASREQARRTATASSIVALTMVSAAILGFAGIVASGQSLAPPTSGLHAAAAVAVLGTAGRLMQTWLSAHRAAGQVALTSHVAALATAVAGVVLLGDEVRPAGLLLLAGAAALSAVAVALRAASHQRVPLPVPADANPGVVDEVFEPFECVCGTLLNKPRRTAATITERHDVLACERRAGRRA